MELHSYAKPRVNVQWTVEQKRRLVEARIKFDYIFNKKTHNIQESWNRIVDMAHLEGFNVLFVRKQWANMISKYKSILAKYTNNKFVDEKTHKMLQGEWEFFTQMHAYMENKGDDFHSYAQRPLDDEEELQARALSDSLLNSDAAQESPFTRKSNVTTAEKGTNTVQFPELDTFKIEESDTQRNELSIPIVKKMPSPLPGTSSNNGANRTPKRPGSHTTKRLSYKNKYFKHCIKYNKRMENKIDALLNVFGQVIAKEYPQVDASKLTSLFTDQDLSSDSD